MGLPAESLVPDDDPPTWARPVNLLAPLAAPPLTRADVPRLIGDAADLFARSAGFDPTGAIVSGVVAVAASIDDAIRIRLPGASGQFESARLWVCMIGPSGAGKSPSQRPALAPVHDEHSELVAAAAKQRDTSPDERTPARAAFTSDCTVDKLADVLRDNPRGIFYTVDEFDSWLGGIESFARDGGSRNRGEWMRLFDGGPHQVDRVQRGAMFVPNWGASILTATTPAALRRHARKLPADGLFQRFLPIVMARMTVRDSTIGWAEVERAQCAYAAAVRGLYAMTADMVDPPIVRLSTAAGDVYETERTRFIALAEAAESFSESLASHVAKYPAILGRLMLTFHAIADDRRLPDGALPHPCVGAVSEATAQLAARFLRKAYRHAHVVHGDLLGAGSPLELAQAIGRTVLADRMDSFNRRTLTHKCRAFRAATEWQRVAALRALEDYGWAIGESLLLEHGGRWTVNPAVHAMFEDEAEQARARRELVRETLRERFE